MRPQLLSLSFVLLTAGCATQPPVEDQNRLASACEMLKCRCVAEKTSSFRVPATDTVKWRPTGAAYCDAGFHLERVVEEKKPGY